MSWNKEHNGYTQKLNNKMNNQQAQLEDVHFAKSRYALEYVGNLINQKKLTLTNVDDIIKESEKIREFVSLKPSKITTL